MYISGRSIQQHSFLDIGGAPKVPIVAVSGWSSVKGRRWWRCSSSYHLCRRSLNHPMAAVGVTVTPCPSCTFPNSKSFVSRNVGELYDIVSTCQGEEVSSGTANIMTRLIMYSLGIQRRWFSRRPPPGIHILHVHSVTIFGDAFGKNNSIALANIFFPNKFRYAIAGGHRFSKEVSLSAVRTFLG